MKRNAKQLLESWKKVKGITESKCSCEGEGDCECDNKDQPIEEKGDALKNAQAEHARLRKNKAQISKDMAQARKDGDEDKWEKLRDDLKDTEEKMDAAMERISNARKEKNEDAGETHIEDDGELVIEEEELEDDEDSEEESEETDESEDEEQENPELVKEEPVDIQEEEEVQEEPLPDFGEETPATKILMAMIMKINRKPAQKRADHMQNLVVILAGEMNGMPSGAQKLRGLLVDYKKEVKL